MTYVTRAEFARICGVSRFTVTRWIKNGRIQETPEGLIDEVAAQRMREETASPEPHHVARKAQFDEARQAAQSARAAQGAFEPLAQGSPLPNAPNPPQSPQNGPGNPFATQRNDSAAMPAAEKIGTALKLETYKLQKAKAETANVELDKMAGALCERSEVDYALNDFGNTLRALLEARAVRLAIQLSPLHGDVAAMQSAIEEADYDVLASMAENMQRKTERLDP